MMSYISLSWHQHNYVVDFSFIAKYAFLTLITFNLWRFSATFAHQSFLNSICLPAYLVIAEKDLNFQTTNIDLGFFSKQQVSYVYKKYANWKELGKRLARWIEFNESKFFNGRVSLQNDLPNLRSIYQLHVLTWGSSEKVVDNHPHSTSAKPCSIT